MTGYTQPDLLAYPDDYNVPADVPADVEALAVTTQAALLLRPTEADLLWEPYVPVLYQGSNLTTQVVSARYAKVGNLIAAQVDVRAQSQGAGLDPWIRCSLPVPARNAPAVPVGQGRYAAPAFPAVWKFHVNLYDTTHVCFEATHLATNTYACIGEDPFHFVTPGDAIQFAAVYEMA